MVNAGLSSALSSSGWEWPAALLALKENVILPISEVRYTFINPPYLLYSRKKPNCSVLFPEAHRGSIGTQLSESLKSALGSRVVVGVRGARGSRRNRRWRGHAVAGSCEFRVLDWCSWVFA